MADHVDRVFAMTGNERGEHLPDLKERHALLLVASQPQGGAFSKRRFAASFLRLALHAEETFLLDANKVCERLLAVRKAVTNALGAGNASGNCNLPRHLGRGWFAGVEHLSLWVGKVAKKCGNCQFHIVP